MALHGAGRRRRDGISRKVSLCQQIQERDARRAHPRGTLQLHLQSVAQVLSWGVGTPSYWRSLGASLLEIGRPSRARGFHPATSRGLWGLGQTTFSAHVYPFSKQENNSSDIGRAVALHSCANLISTAGWKLFCKLWPLCQSFATQSLTLQGFLCDGGGIPINRFLAWRRN